MMPFGHLPGDPANNEQSGTGPEEELLLAYLRSPDAPPLITPTAQVQGQGFGTGAVAA